MSTYKRGRTVAWAHRYLRADGSLGASGLPDPKAVWEDGMIYRLVPGGQG
jgi:hypothetical protein